MSNPVDLHLVQGETFVSDDYVWQDEDGNPEDLTGAVARLKIRSVPEASATELLSLTHGTGITLGTVGGEISFRITPTQSLALPRGVYVWDLYIGLPSLDAYRVLYGSVFVAGAVSQ